MLPKASRQSPKPSDAAFGEALHIQRAVSHVLGQAEITDLLSGKCRPSPTEFRVLIARALQAYSAEHGVLNLVNKMRECIGDTR